MRLRTFDHILKFAVSTTLAGLVPAAVVGCHPKPKGPAPLQSSKFVPPPPVGTTPPRATPPATTTVSISTRPATEPATMPAPATLPAATQQAAAVPVVPIPATPVTQPATAPATRPALHPADLPTDKNTLLADAALAERVCGFAELDFPDKVNNNNAWQYIWAHEAAMLMAASRLDGRQGRYPRLAVDAYAQNNDTAGETTALVAAVGAKRDDEFSLNKLVDLHLSQMETADRKVDYLQQLMAAGVNKIPADVQAHAAVRCAREYLDRGQETLAKTTLAEALRKNPSSIEALQLRYTMLPADAPRFQRCEELTDLLRANPLQFDYCAELAGLVAGSGLANESLPFYEAAVTGTARERRIDLNAMLDWAAALYILDQANDASHLAGQLTKIAPGMSSGWFLQLVISRSDAKNPAAFNDVLGQATNAMTDRLIEVVNALKVPNVPPATTRPVSAAGDFPPPDLSPATAELTATGTPQAKRVFAEAVADLARLDIYFAKRPAEGDKLLDALQAVLTADDPVVLELRGLADLQAGRTDDAKAKLARIASDNPLAALGLAQITAKTNPQAAGAMGRKLLQDYPSGLVGAMLVEGLASQRVQLVPPAQADAIKQLLQNFPANWLKLGDRPSDFYAIHLEAAQSLTTLAYNQPVLVEMTIANLSNNDLTVGFDGVIKPALMFVVTPQVEKSPQFRGVDYLAGPMVIKPRESMRQTIRVDQTQLLNYLNASPGVPAFDLGMSLATNQTVGGIGGYGVNLATPFYRLPMPLTPEVLKQVLDELTGGTPDRKIMALDQLGMMVRQIRQQLATPDAPKELQQQQSDLLDTLHKTRQDSVASVAAWASRVEFDLVSAAERANILRDLTAENESLHTDWRWHQVALMLSGGVDPSVAAEIIDKLVDDPQPTVRADAEAKQRLLNLPAGDAAPAGPTTLPTH